MDSHLLSSIADYKKRLEKGVGIEKTLHILRKLERIPFTVDLLKETGIGKVVRKISKENDGDVREKAKHLCSEWRRLVREMPDNEADMKLSEIHSSKKVKFERDDSLKKVNKYENAAVNGAKSSGGDDAEMNWSTKSGSKCAPQPKLASGNDEKSGKPERRLPTMNEVKEAAQRLNGSRVATNSNSDNMLGFTSKRARTTVYAGQARTTQYTHVLRLEDLCVRVLMDHIEHITCLGCVPYYLMKPVLKKCTPQQLFNIEDHNPSYVDEDDELWFEHCQMEFKNHEPDEHESWRELYIRCQVERDNKLKMISGKINRQQRNSGPARKTMLVEGPNAGCPRNVQRLQQKYGTAAPVHYPGPSPVAVRAAMKAAGSTFTKSSNPPKKAKTAPLMAKSLQLLKTRFRR